MVNSHFANPNGLNAEGHYSSAYDMALLARACLENEALAEIAATKSATVDGRVLTNHNKLLWQYEGCIGLKTGYTEKAGRTLVSAARRDGMTLIAVTLNDPDDWRGPRRPAGLRIFHLCPGDADRGGKGRGTAARVRQPGPLCAGPGGGDVCGSPGV